MQFEGLVLGCIYKNIPNTDPLSSELAEIDRVVQRQNMETCLNKFEKKSTNMQRPCFEPSTLNPQGADSTSRRSVSNLPEYVTQEGLCVLIGVRFSTER